MGPKQDCDVIIAIHVDDNDKTKSVSRQYANTNMRQDTLIKIIETSAVTVIAEKRQGPPSKR